MIQNLFKATRYSQKTLQSNHFQTDTILILLINKSYKLCTMPYTYIALSKGTTYGYIQSKIVKQICEIAIVYHLFIFFHHGPLDIIIYSINCK